MSEISVNSILDASGGATTTINGFTPTVSNMAGRNRIINGDMRIDQRNAGASVTPTNAYTLDRWIAIHTGGKFSVQRNAGAVTPPFGFTNYLGVTSLSAYSVGAAEFYQIKQHLEGFNVADFAWGTASASPITVSFWVRSSLTGNFGLVVSWGSSASNQRSYPVLYSISSANTWEYKTITIPGDTTMPSGGFETGAGSGVQLRFSLGGGATNAGASGSWAATNYQSVVGDTSVVGTSGATFYITGVQLEAGSVATPFEHRQYGQELALCQRYYNKYGPQISAHNKIGSGYISSGTLGVIAFSGLSMRASPTVGFSSAQITDASTNAVITSVAGTNAHGCGVNVEFAGSGGGLVTGRGAAIRLDTTGFIDMSSEL